MGEEKFDEFVEGDAMAKEAEEMFGNEGKPVHYLSLSTRFGGVNYRVFMLIATASFPSKKYTATYNPNFFNKFTRSCTSRVHITLHCGLSS